MAHAYVTCTQFSHVCVCVRAGTRRAAVVHLALVRLARIDGEGRYGAKERARERDRVSRAVHRRHPWHAPTLTIVTAICTLSHRKIKVDSQHCRRRHRAPPLLSSTHLASPRLARPVLVDIGRYFATLPSPSRMYSHAYTFVHI